VALMSSYYARLNNIANAHGVSPLALARTIGNFDVKQYFADLSG
jgi:hypothetical protein